VRRLATSLDVSLVCDGVIYSLLGGDRSSGLVFLVLPGIWETRDNSSNSLGRSSLASCNMSPAPITELVD
jgi:hypothetical protein